MVKHKRDTKPDENQIASGIVKQVTADPPVETSGKNPHAVALGRLGGKKGGPARAHKLSARRRKEIARKAARTRWSTSHKNQPLGS